ncbi:DJ-1/PfpI family protein [Candidatus Micrarchaeota archaeon]|nr:DJ-1/PfpI family protein [Candidatus Micrarchaeota archaeon]
MSRILLLIPPSGFKDGELEEAKKTLSGGGHKLTIVSDRKSPSLGILWTKENPQAKLSDIKAGEFDALLLIGGPGASYYYKQERAHSVMREFLDGGKPVGAMDLAVSVLARANLLSGRKVACWPLEKKLVESKGATPSGEGVTIDGNLITMMQPSFTTKFLEAFSSKL